MIQQIVFNVTLKLITAKFVQTVLNANYVSQEPIWKAMVVAPPVKRVANPVKVQLNVLCANLDIMKIQRTVFFVLMTV